MVFTDEATKKERLDTEDYQVRSGQGECLLMTRGVIVRHLLLPGNLADSKQVIAYLLETYGEQIFISIMSQYTPLPHVSAYPELQRCVSAEEYEALVDYALELGIENGFIQEGEAAQESFIPEFDGKGLFPVTKEAGWCRDGKENGREKS